jgi:hypothetical protein
MGPRDVSTTAPATGCTTGRRREARLRVRLAARYISLDGSRNTILADISEHGARMHGPLPGGRPGAEVILQWPGGELFGTVVWIAPDQWGMAFYDPLTPAEIQRARLIDERHRLPDDRERVRQSAQAFVQGKVRL